MLEIEIDDVKYIIPENLKSFIILKKKSSNVDFYGINDGRQLFFQFFDGTSIIYEDLSDEDFEEVQNTQSIGKFQHKIKGKYSYRRVSDKILPAATETALLKEDVKAIKGFHGKKLEEVKILKVEKETYLVKGKSGNFYVSKSQLLFKNAN